MVPPIAPVRGSGISSTFDAVMECQHHDKWSQSWLTDEGEEIMNIRQPRDRIWTNTHNAERLSLYYSRRAEQLAKRQRQITFAVSVPLIVAVALLQLNWAYAFQLVSGLLFLTGLCEAGIIHFRVGEDIRVAKVKAIQANEVAYQWRLLWIDQNRGDIVQWIELLERMNQQITAESILHSKKKGENHLDNKCAEDAKHALAIQFGG